MQQLKRRLSRRPFDFFPLARKLELPDPRTCFITERNVDKSHRFFGCTTIRTGNSRDAYAQMGRQTLPDALGDVMRGLQVF